ncbi:MAG: DUF21 domain-containing protein, partial [Flavobacterium sp.]
MEVSIIIICLILSAFFSGMEIAYISSNKVYLGIEKKQDNFLSKILSKLTENPSKFIASMLIGNNIALVVYGFFMGELIMEQLAFATLTSSIWATVSIQIFISALVIIITSEFLPKIFFQIYANTLIKALAIPAYIFYQLFYYVSSAIIWISDIILMKVFKIKGDNEQLLFSKVELGNYITEQMKSVEDQE